MGTTSAEHNRVECRENTEGEYSGLEHEVVPDVVESLKVRMCHTPASAQRSFRVATNEKLTLGDGFTEPCCVTVWAVDRTN